MSGLLLFSLTVLCVASPVWADSYSFNLSSFSNNNASSYTFTAGSYSLIATGYSANGASTTGLYYKTTTGNPGATGLGLASFAQNGIGIGQFIQLDLGASPKFTLTAVLSGLQTGDGYNIWASNTAACFSSQSCATSAISGGATGTPGANQSTVSLASLSGDRYIDISAKDLGAGSGSNVLLGSMVAVAAVPEPATMGLLATGLAGLLGGRRFKKPLR
jgi:hypothetical protein